MTNRQPYDDVIRRSPCHHHHLLPQVILAKPPLVLAKYLPQLADLFDLIKAYESPIPINDYLSKYGNKVKVMFCSDMTTTVDRELVDLSPCLELIFTTSAGLNQIYSTGVGREVLGLLVRKMCFRRIVRIWRLDLSIDVLRRVSSVDRFVKRGGWLRCAGVFPLGLKVVQEAPDKACLSVKDLLAVSGNVLRG